MNLDLENPSEKVQLFEHLANDILLEELKIVTKQREDCFEKIAQYCQLQTMIEKLMNDVGAPIHAQVDLGCNFYAQAAVKDPSRIVVNIGYGFFLEMAHDEALKFITQKLSRLNNQAKKYTKILADHRARVRYVGEVLRNIHEEDL